MAINHVRSTGHVQIVLTRGRRPQGLDDAQKVAKKMQEFLKGMTLEGECFIVSDPPTKLDDDVYLIDVTRTMGEVNKTGPPPVIEDHGEIDDERQKVLVMSIEDFAGELMKTENVKRRARFSEVFDSVVTWRGLTHVWHLCEYGVPNLQDLDDQYRQQLESTVSEALAVYGFRLRMNFRPEYRAQFIAVTGDRIPFEVR